MKAITFLNKPTYWFRPSRVISRLTHRHGRGFEDVRVAWGTTLTCNTSEDIGRAIWNQGIYDLVVSEAICRLLRVGGTAIDVGANVGHMTGLMAKQAGPSGRVISFEPSSRIRATLSRNVARWANDRRFAPISIVASAASDYNGRHLLYYAADVFLSNNGTASMDQSWGGGKAVESEEVETITLDRALSAQKGVIDVLKIDVEGHELGVLKGASDLLRTKRVTHIIFEDMGQYPSPVHRLLEDAGYKVYRLARSFVRIEAVAPGDMSVYPIDVMRNYLATAEPQAIAREFSRWGWSALRPSFRQE
jgi:FkbM family methyltransferase